MTRNQEADLRVVAVKEGLHALVLTATLRNENLYWWTGPLGISESWHRSGVTGTKVESQHRLVGKREPLKEFKGKRRLCTTSCEATGLDWSYKPKADSATRKTLKLELGEFPGTADLWAIENGRKDLVESVLSEYAYWQEILGTVHIDETQPQLLVVAWSLDRQQQELFQQSIVSQGFPPGKLTAIVTGPGPPIGPVRTMPLDDASSTYSRVLDISDWEVHAIPVVGEGVSVFTFECVLSGEPGTYDLTAEIIGPSGTCDKLGPSQVTVPVASVLNYTLQADLKTAGPGSYTLHLSVGDNELGVFPFEVVA